MSFASEYEELRKKRLAEEAAKNRGSLAPIAPIYNTLNYNPRDIKPKAEYEPKEEAGNAQKTITYEDAAALYDTLRRKNRTGEVSDEDLRAFENQFSLLRQQYHAEKNAKPQEKAKWFNGGAFKDGYQFGDVTKTFLGTWADMGDNINTAVVDATENLIDTTAFIIGATGGLVSKDFQKGVGEFIAKDTLHTEETGKALTNLTPAGWLNMLANGGDAESNSVLGEKADGLVQSGAHLVGSTALQYVGVPSWLTMGVNAFGSEIEQAFGEGATYTEAGVSGAISAAAEVLFEKLSGGIKILKGTTLDEGATRWLSDKISNKLVRTLAKYGMDMAGEGAEEVLTEAASAVGRKITYADEKEFNELFSSEDAFDAFVGGAVMSGVAGGGKIVDAKSKGVDYTSGLTANEEIVVKQEVADRIAEAEKDGKKLSGKEKTKIYDQVVEDIRKGYVSTDTIEKVLGGDSYKTYKDTLDGEETAINKLRELYEGEELDAAIKDIRDNSKSVELKAKLREDVLNQAKKGDAFLFNSYSEVDKRGQKFEADLDSYTNEYAKQTIKNIMESGVANNTGRMHDFANNVLAKISADKSIVFSVTDAKKLAETDFAVDGKTVNGYVTEDGITINIDSPKYLNTVVGHEITHVLEGTEFYDALQETIVEYAKTKGEYKNRLRDTHQLYKGVKGYEGVDGFNKVEKEVVADLVGDYLFDDPDFISHLSTSNRNVFQKLYDEIKYLYNLATAGSKEKRQLERVKKAFEDAYRADGKAELKTKTADSKTDLKDIENRIKEFSGKVNDAKVNTKYSVTDKKTIDKYSQKQYNDFGWARDVGAISKNELDDLHSKGQEKGTFKKFTQTSDGEAIVEVNDDPHAMLKVNNVFAFVKGAKDDFEITRVVRVNFNDEALVDVFRKDIYGNSGKRALAAYARAMGEEAIRYYDRSSSADYRAYADRTRTQQSGIGSEGNTGAYRNGKQRVWHFEETQSDEIESNNKASSKDGVFFDGKKRKFSLSDSDGTKLTKEQSEYFKDSKMRDENGNLKVMYHGSQDAGFHTFDSSMSDDGTSFFFVDRNDVAASYSGTSETYEAQTIRTAEDMNKFIEKIGVEGYEVVENDGKFSLLYEGESIAESDTAQGIYDEFCWYEGVGEGDANYKVYLNLKNPLEVDAKGRPWNKIDAEFSQEVYDKYNSLTPEEKAALVDLAEWEDFRLFNSEIQEAKGNELASAYEKMGEDVNIYDLFSVAADNFSEDSMRENARKYLNTRDYAQRAKEGGYDGVILKNVIDNGGYSSGDEGASTVAIAFDSNQIKSVANDKPTADKDIRHSLSENGEKPRSAGRYGVRGEDVKLQIAPIREDIAENATTTPDNRTTSSVMEQVAPEDGMPEGFAPMSEEEAINLASENLASLSDSDAPMESDTEYYDFSDTSSLKDTETKNIANSLVDVLGLDKKDMANVEDVIQRYSTGEIQSEDALYDEIKGKFGQKVETREDERLADIKRDIRTRPMFVSDSIKRGIEGYRSFMRSNFGKIRFSKNGTGVDSVYMELSELYPEYFPEDVVNPIDELLLISEVVNYNHNIQETYDLLDEDIQTAVDTIVSEVGKTKEAGLMEAVEADRQALMDDIAPVIQKEPDKAYEAIRPKKQSTEPRMKRVKESDVAPTAEGHTAEVYDTEPEAPKKKNKGWTKFRTNFLDKQSVFEDLSLKTKNRELMSKANYMLSSESRAQRMIGHGIKSQNIKSLDSIRSEVESTGKTKEFYEYMYHRHNIDRMNLDTRYEDVANKPVFGDSVTAEVSQSIVDQYEAENPAFKEYAEDVYSYMNYLRKQLVDNGVISSETADLWAEMYPHYVPIRRLGDSGLNINVPLDTGKTGINAPIKKATGGNRDILPLFDTMAMRTEQTFKAVAKNSFGVELKNTLGTTIESAATDLDGVIDSVDKHEELLQEGKNGQNPTFTVFENGERVTFEISEEMYDALKPTSKGLAYTNKVANTVSNVHRGILTEYNPAFMASNAIKDAQDILINSQHPAKTYAKLPQAYKELATKGKWYTEYMENGGEQNTYFDGQSHTFEKNDSKIKKVIGMPLNAIKAANNFVERAPRLAEYIASRESGASVETAMLDAARVTTNFQAGGDVTKWFNRNGVTFLNASVQGFNQQVRNIREAKANGLKGWVQLAAKFTIAGLPALLLNNLVWKDDEEYEELSDYVKDNYYIVAKYGDGKFVRIPKGRTVAVIQNAFQQVSNAITGDDEVDLKNFLDLAISNLAPNNPIDNNIIAPISQAVSNKTWYGEDLVPTRLQDLPAAEQYDESTDAFSKWLGEKTNISPYKINYILDQYSGGVGDVFLPMMTPEAERGDNSFVGNVIAPIKDKFTTDSTMNNQNVTDFYDTMDKLTTNAKSSKATDEDILKHKYMNSINSELAELYQQKREIQNSNLSDSEKYEAVREIQEQIVSLTRDSLNSYEDVKIEGVYATVGDVQFRWYEPGEDSEAEAGWRKLTADQLEDQDEVTSGLGITPSEYWSNKTEYDFAYEYPEKYTVAKALGGYESYKTYASELYDIKADKDSSGKSITGSRKEKVIEYVNSLDVDYGARLILFKSEYNADDTYNYEIIDYLNNREDISYNDMVTILKELGFTVDSRGNIYWD